jgi:hypothetical protein
LGTELFLDLKLGAATMANWVRFTLALSRLAGAARSDVGAERMAVASRPKAKEPEVEGAIKLVGG